MLLRVEVCVVVCLAGQFVILLPGALLPPPPFIWLPLLPIVLPNPPAVEIEEDFRLDEDFNWATVHNTVNQVCLSAFPLLSLRPTARGV